MARPGTALRVVLLCGIYAVVYALLRETPAQANLSAGFRLAVFLLAPRRWWAAVLVTDIATSAAIVLPHVGTAPYTVPWFISASALPALASMTTAACWKAAGIKTRPRDQREATYLLVAIGLAALLAAMVGATNTSLLQGGAAAVQKSISKVLAIYGIGAFLGIMAIVPVSAIAMRSIEQRTWNKVRLDRTVLAFLGTAAWFGLTSAGCATAVDAQDVTLWRLMMFLPALPIAMAGWEATVAIVMLFCMALDMTQPVKPFEESLFGLQQWALAFCCAALVVAAKIECNRRSQAARARRSDRVEEAMRRALTGPGSARAHQLSMVDAIYDSIAEFPRARPHADDDESQQAWWHAISTARRGLRHIREQIADPLLERHGLRAAVCSGVAARTLRDLGIPYYVDIRGDLRAFDQEVLTAAHRIAHDSIAALFRTSAPAWVRVAVRAVHRKRGSILIVRVRSRPHPDSTLSHSASALVPALDGTGLLALAHAFGGALELRHGAENRVTAFVAQQAASAVPAWLPHRHSK